MPAPNDLNNRIGLVKRWTWDEELHICSAEMDYAPSHWRNPEGIPAPRPDFVGTLEGLAGLMRELQEDQYRKEKALLHPPDIRLHWSWTYVPQEKVYHCSLKNQGGGRYIVFESPDDHPGDCVGEAWMSVKEAADASTK